MISRSGHRYTPHLYSRKEQTVDAYPPADQRAALLRLMSALGCSDSALCRDECGDWRINGKHGHVYAVCGTVAAPGRPGFMTYVSCETARAWTFAKQALSFAKVTNDGDDDGAFFLGHLPSKTEAEVIRRYCGILKKRDIGDAMPSEAQLAARAAFADRRRAQIAAAQFLTHDQAGGMAAENCPSRAPLLPMSQTGATP